jgi:hypothetical protein
MKWEPVEGSGGKYFIINPSTFLKELSDNSEEVSDNIPSKGKEPNREPP